MVTRDNLERQDNECTATKSSTRRMRITTEWPVHTRARRLTPRRWAQAHILLGLKTTIVSHDRRFHWLRFIDLPTLPFLSLCVSYGHARHARSLSLGHSWEPRVRQLSSHPLSFPAARFRAELSVDHQLRLWGRSFPISESARCLKDRVTIWKGSLPPVQRLHCMTAHCCV